MRIEPARRGWRLHTGLAAAAVAVGLAAGAGAWDALRPLPPLSPSSPSLASSPSSSAGSVGAPVCAAGTRPGAAGRDDTLRTADGLPVSVRTPSDYDATRAHPLLVVYPPAGFSRVASERFYGLTPQATARGYVVAYSAAVPLSRRALELQRQVAATVASRWCIDAARLAFLGHSDGGSVAQGVLLRGAAQAPWPGHVLASAAGIRGSDLLAERCPPATRITVVHGSHDALFPGYGRQAARWWAGCFGCAGASRLDAAIAADSCADLGPCASGAGVRYCETDAAHATWPRVAREPFTFLGSPAVASVSAAAAAALPAASLLPSPSAFPPAFPPAPRPAPPPAAPAAIPSRRS